MALPDIEWPQLREIRVASGDTFALDTSKIISFLKKLTEVEVLSISLANRNRFATLSIRNILIGDVHLSRLTSLTLSFQYYSGSNPRVQDILDVLDLPCIHEIHITGSLSDERDSDTILSLQKLIVRSNASDQLQKLTLRHFDLQEAEPFRTLLSVVPNMVELFIDNAHNNPHFFPGKMFSRSILASLTAPRCPRLETIRLTECLDCLESQLLEFLQSRTMQRRPGIVHLRTVEIVFAARSHNHQFWDDELRRVRDLSGIDLIWRGGVPVEILAFRKVLVASPLEGLEI
jgi:hypothetical protein